MLLVMEVKEEASLGVIYTPLDLVFHRTQR